MLGLSPLAISLGHRNRRADTERETDRPRDREADREGGRREQSMEARLRKEGAGGWRLYFLSAYSSQSPPPPPPQKGGSGGGGVFIFYRLILRNPPPPPPQKGGSGGVASLFFIGLFFAIPPPPPRSPGQCVRLAAVALSGVTTTAAADTGKWNALLTGHFNNVQLFSAPEIPAPQNNVCISTKAVF